MDRAAPRLTPSLAPSPVLARRSLATLLAVTALNAFGGGVYGLAGARDVPTEWLAGSPFRDYFVPSLVLFAVVGGSLAFSAVAVWIGARVARGSAFAAGAILIGWIAAQVAIIGYVSWLQPAMVGVALVVAGLAAALPRIAARQRSGFERRPLR